MRRKRIGSKNLSSRRAVPYENYRIRRLTLMASWWRRKAMELGYDGTGYTQSRRILDVRKPDTNLE